MNNHDFRKHAHQLVDWMADYMENLHELPVKPNISPGDIKNQLPALSPGQGEDFERIFEDFKNIILPGMTHWQHPQFFAYFPTGWSGPSILAEMLVATMGAQCMTWLTSPAAEELEERMMEWLRDAFGLPANLTGVIQDGSSSATLVAILSAREAYSGFAINRNGFTGKEKFRIYTSSQAHSSVDKAVKIAGIGIENLIKIETDEAFALIPEKLEAAIAADIQQGFSPLCVVSTIGSTSSTAIDPIAPIGAICAKYHCWHHIDASYAGVALILPEMRWMISGIEAADSIVINPHKWMFTHMDLSAYYVKNKQTLLDTFSILPEYLKTPEDKLVNNYRDWGIPLGRRFRALKLWFVMRTYGLEGIQQIIRRHIEYGQWLRDEIAATAGFEVLAPVPLNLVCFRFKPEGIRDEETLENLNKTLLNNLNNSGRILLTQTKLDGKYVIRFVAGQINTRKEDLAEGWALIRKEATALLQSFSASPSDRD